MVVGVIRQPAMRSVSSVRTTPKNAVALTVAGIQASSPVMVAPKSPCLKRYQFAPRLLIPVAAFQLAEASLVMVPVSRLMETIFAATPPAVAAPEVPSAALPSSTIPASNQTMSLGFRSVTTVEPWPEPTWARAPPPLPKMPLQMLRSAVFFMPRTTASTALTTAPALSLAALTSSVSMLAVA